MKVRAAITTPLLILILAGNGLAAGVDNSPLVDATRAANWSVVRSLVSKGLSGDAINAADTDGTRPLHFAVRADQLEIAELLLRAGADATAQNRLGVTPLYLAAQNGNALMIRKLLGAGANANQVDRTTG